MHTKFHANIRQGWSKLFKTLDSEGWEGKPPFFDWPSSVAPCASWLPSASFASSPEGVCPVSAPLWSWSPSPLSPWLTPSTPRCLSCLCPLPHPPNPTPCSLSRGFYRPSESPAQMTFRTALPSHSPRCSVVYVSDKALGSVFIWKLAALESNPPSNKSRISDSVIFGGSISYHICLKCQQNSWTSSFLFVDSKTIKSCLKWFFALLPKKVWISKTKWKLSSNRIHHLECLRENGTE